MKGYKILRNSASESGLTFITATGKETSNLGEKIVVVATTEGSTRSIKFQMCDVTKCLASVSRIVEAGHRVILDTPEAGSYIENRHTGERTYLRQERGLYLLDAWVMPYTEVSQTNPFQGAGCPSMTTVDRGRPLRPIASKSQVPTIPGELYRTSRRQMRR